MNGPAGDDRDRIDAVVGVAWALMVGVTALGHVTALRNMLTVVVALVTLGLYRRQVRGFPGKGPIVALLIWAVLSTLWSPVVDVTLGKLRTDLLIPVLAGLAAFAFARRPNGLRAVTDGLVVGLALLAALSLFAYLPAGYAPSGWVLEQNGGIVRPLPHWYPGPGDASMFAILAIAPLTLAWRQRRWDGFSRARTACIGLGAVLLAFVLVTTNNRNAVLVAPLVFAFQWALDRRVDARTAAGTEEGIEAGMTRRRPLLRAVTVTAGAIVAIGALAAVLEWGARERLAYLHRPMTGDSAAVELVATDPRPTIWRYYLSHGLAHPWIGFGFGRTVPGIALQTERDRTLAAVDANAYIHAHNVVVNWWLQLGLVGLALVVASVLAIVRAARLLVQHSSDRVDARRLDHALLAVLVAVFARNLTDDFLVYGMATATAVVVGALLGALTRAAAVPPGAPAALLGPEPGQHRGDRADADHEVERE